MYENYTTRAPQRKPTAGDGARRLPTLRYTSVVRLPGAAITEAPPAATAPFQQRSWSTMLAALLAALSALGYGTGQFLTQLGLRHGRVRSPQALLINLTAATILLVGVLAVSWTVQEVTLDWRGVAYFAAAGVMAPFAGRSMNFMAIQRVGATRTASLGMSENFFAAALAWILLGQSLSTTTLLGIAVLVVGMVLFINETARAFSRTQATEGGDAATRARRGRSAAAGVVFGLISGFFFSTAGIFRELGLDLLPSALLGATVGTGVALLVNLGNVLRAGQLRGVFRVSWRDALPLALSGIVASAGMVSFFFALQLGGGLAVSTALKNLTPLFTFGLSALFIAHLERVSLRLGLLVLGVVAGAVVMTLGRM